MIMVSPTEDEKGLEEEVSSTSQDTEQGTEVSSDSETSEEDSSTFDVVMKAIKPEDETEDDSSSEKEQSEDSEGNEKPEGDEEVSDEPNEEELKAWKPKTRKRFEQLQDRYRSATEEINTLKEQISKDQADAEQFRQYNSFLEENQLSKEEANTLFNIGALMKNDPFEALRVITPYYQSLMQVTGNILPQDLQQQVNEGYITKEHAFELSQARAGNAYLQNRQNQQQQVQQQPQATHQQQSNTIPNAIASWEKQWQSSDPDYNSKKDRVLERVELLLARAARENKLPKTEQEAVNLANEAKKFVENDLRQFAPKKSVTPVSGNSTPKSLPEAQNTADVIRRTVSS